MYFNLLYGLFTVISPVLLAKGNSINLINEKDDCKIFCSGKILHHIQMSRIFNDSKYFVDMKLKYKSQEIINRFSHLLNETNNHPNNSQLSKFVVANFEPPGAGVSVWEPEDWHEHPFYISLIHDLQLQKWLLMLNEIWKRLGRKLNEDVINNEELYSQIFVPNPFIVPGGRFSEFYYWDSYWIIDGLLISDMKDTAKYMINNFIYLVEKYGYVPNGGRKYYFGRSQPPFLVLMVDLYIKATEDMSFLKQNIKILEKEFNFWYNNRKVFIKKGGIQYQAFQYKVNSTNPRPESYYEDVNEARALNLSSRNKFFSNIKAAAESGWDFSSRWLIYQGKNTNDIQDINTEWIVPVCLNSIMGKNAFLLSKFFKILGDEINYNRYSEVALNINRSISRLFWNDEEGIWLDYNKITNKHQTGFYMSSFMPLWSETYGVEYQKEYIIRKVIAYIKKFNLTSYPGGVPTSLQNSSQQWDYPNGWAPLQYFLILGLNKAKEFNLEAGELAYLFAEKWIKNCYLAYFKSTPPAMFEKYDITQLGIPGRGGEYLDQNGFGWSNGVIIKLLNLYGHKIHIHTRGIDVISLVLALVLFIITLFVITNYIYRNNFSSPRKRNLEQFSPNKFNISDLSQSETETFL